jgi:hypothetical protein
MCDHRNPDISKLGFKATDAFLMEVAIALKNEDAVQTNKEIFWVQRLLALLLDLHVLTFL